MKLDTRPARIVCRVCGAQGTPDKLGRPCRNLRQGVHGIQPCEGRFVWVPRRKSQV